MSFDLSSISKTKRIRAPKVVIGGPGKIGKTTFAASAPKSIGILTEDGADDVDAMAFPMCKTLNDVYSAIGTLYNESHEFENVWLDSLDWLEPMLHAHVCEQNNWANIEAPGFGKGYVAAAEEWRNLLAGFEALRTDKNMGVIMIAHDKVKRLDSPMSDGYDTYTLKINDRAMALVQEWADILGFANYEIMTRSAEKGFGQKETKALATGKRILHVEPHPAHFGGNRFGMKNMPLEWSVFAEQLASIRS